ncbi:MAG: hypothetical protein HYR96_13170 [Deltaproteobacteria bacterium]|nr:hypothetical protein [Deltaproteobacteria bacterium]MBI3295675.1 hypothetical protein [Deltaproteobacteria bacterium]
MPRVIQPFPNLGGVGNIFDNMNGSLAHCVVVGFLYTVGNTLPNVISCRHEPLHSVEVSGD